jgi:hypothetical protein
VMTLDEHMNTSITDTLRPVEILILLKMFKALYSLDEEEHNEDNLTFDSIREVTNKYVKRYLEASGETLSCARILYALSVFPNKNRQLTIKQISEITQLEIKNVKKIVAFLTGKGLLREIKSAEIEFYDWTHDFFAEKFNEMSTSILEPEDRDNIGFFWDLMRRSDQVAGFIREDNKNRKYKELYGKIILITSIITLFIRFFWPTVGKLNWESPFSKFNSFKGFERIDIFFLPVLISLTCWAVYIYFIHNRLLTSIAEKGFFTKFFSWILPLESFACVILTTLYPTQWLTFTGVGGFFVGIKFILLARTKSRSGSVSLFPSFKGWFLSAGIQTVIHCTILILCGVFFYSSIFGSTSTLRDPSLVNVSVISIFLWIIMVYFAVGVSINHHARKAIIPTLRGEYIRNQYR